MLAMVTTHDLTLADGRSLRVHDAGSPERFAVIWHHGSPQTGAPLEPLISAAAERGIRLLSYARPSYGGSSPQRGRTVGHAASDVHQLADALGLARFAVMGASGGGPHALACAALLPDRVSATACLASLAPSDANGLDFLAGMAADGESLKAAFRGREAREKFELTATFDPASFNADDYLALATTWNALEKDVQASAEWGMQGLIDDDLAFANAWGFAVTDIATPVLVVQGGDDRVVPAAHGRWLARSIHDSELWLREGVGHISVLNECAVALDWLVAHSTN